MYNKVVGSNPFDTSCECHQDNGRSNWSNVVDEPEPTQGKGRVEGEDNLYKGDDSNELNHVSVERART